MGVVPLKPPNDSKHILLAFAYMRAKGLAVGGVRACYSAVRRLQFVAMAMNMKRARLLIAAPLAAAGRRRCGRNKRRENERLRTPKMARNKAPTFVATCCRGRKTAQPQTSTILRSALTVVPGYVYGYALYTHITFAPWLDAQVKGAFRFTKVGHASITAVHRAGEDSKMKTIGLCMIAKNEANVITRCLDSARPLIDYVLLEDTGSTDGTPGIVREWLCRNNIPGLVIEEPWRDFAYNRSHALETLRKVETVDYAGIMDPDNQLVLEAGFDPVAFKEEMQHDIYHVQIRHGHYHWRLPYLFANHLPFRFIGVVHETLKLPITGLRETITEGFYVQTGREGWRNNNPRKYQDDAAMLEKALLTETDPFLISRYTFYLAQSYRDCGEPEKALTNYLKCAQQGFWQEEVFFSLFQAGILQESLGFPPEQVLATLLRASDASLPDRRVEPLHRAARYCRSLGRYEEGYHYAKCGSPLKMPENGLFVTNWIYAYGILEELARNAFCAGRPQESLKACQRLLRDGKVPAEVRTDVKKISDLAAGIVAGYYIVPIERLDSDKYRSNSEVLEEALSGEDDPFLRARYTFYLALCHQDEGEGGKALATSEDAVRLYRELPARDADASLLGFAAALDNLSHRLSDFARYEEALAASEEAVRLYREWSSSTPNAPPPELASALNNLARQLSHFARYEEALAATEAARTIQSRPM
jgi:tetratricopeptide (TPR) repeat protein